MFRFRRLQFVQGARLLIGLFILSFGLLFCGEVSAVGELKILEIAPSSALSVGGDTVSIIGEGFDADAKVAIGSQIASDVEVVDDGLIRVVVPTAISAGNVDVRVTNGDGETAVKAEGLSYLRTDELKVKAVAGGMTHTLIVDEENRVFSWGSNYSGELGNNRQYADSLRAVASDKIASGNNYSLALDSTGQVYAWGDNSYGQLGDSTNTSRAVPVNISTSSILASKTIVSIYAGSEQSFAIDSDGAVYAWGRNTNAQLGDNTVVNKNRPTLINNGAIAGKFIKKIAVGDSHTLALDSNGVVYAWGYNPDGRLGNNTTAQNNVAVAITGGAINGKVIEDIAAGYYHSVAVDNNGKVYAWGNNTYG